MTALPDIPSDLPDRRLSLLGELAELGLKAARVIVARAEDVSPAETAQAVDRVSRAVRLTVMLYNRVAAEIERDGTDADPTERRKARVQRIVERVAEADPKLSSDRIETLVCDAADRLDDEDLYGDLMDHPIRDIVARICKDLDLTPDWTVLGQELWAKEDMAFEDTRPPPLAGVRPLAEGDGRTPGGPAGDPQGGGGMPHRYPMPPQSLRDSSPASGGARGSLSEQFQCAPRASPSDAPDD